MVFGDSSSPVYQKFRVDKLPTILKFEKVDYKLLLAYYNHKYNKIVNPIQRRNDKYFLRKLNVLNVEHLMSIFTIIIVVKVSFNSKFWVLHKKTNYETKPIVFVCPYCGTTFADQK